MCGRYTLRHPLRLDPALFGVASFPPMPPRYNIAPGQEVLVVRAVDGTRAAGAARWGLVPSWATDPAIGHKLANARGETVAEKPSFRSAWKMRRALLPADGYYEWQILPGVKAKQPWFITLAGDTPFAMGALWESWRAPDGTTVVTTTVITTEANAATSHIHHRMPVIVPQREWARWLGAEHGTAALSAELLRPWEGDSMRTVRVSPWVNAPAHDDPRCVEPLDAAEER